MANSDIVTNLLTDLTTQFGLDPIMNIYISGTGAVNLAPITILVKTFVWMNSWIKSTSYYSPSLCPSSKCNNSWDGSWAMKNPPWPPRPMWLSKQLNQIKRVILACLIIKIFGWDSAAALSTSLLRTTSSEAAWHLRTPKNTSSHTKMSSTVVRCPVYWSSCGCV